MIEYNAAGARVATRPPWVLALLTLATLGLYRIYWIWRTETDLAAFGRSRTLPSGAPSIAGNPGRSACLLALAFPGWLALYVVALPWGSSFAPASYGGTETTTGTRIAFTLVAVAFLLPAAIVVWRLRGRVRRARALAGLPEDTPWLRLAFLPALACEVASTPAWMFVVQHAVDDLWAHFPVLVDEDLHGALAPPALAEAARARRPDLHEQRLRRIAVELERPDLRPWVTVGFAALCVAAFGWQLTQHGWFPSLADIEDVGGLRADIDGGWWRFWAANVLHGGVDHLTGNMLVWLVVAAMVERVVGHLRLVALIVVGAAGCSAGALWMAPDDTGIGASGVVFAVFGLAIAVDPFARRAVGRFGWLLALVGLGISTFAPGISSGGHLGGFAAGVAFGIVVAVAWRIPRVERTWSGADLLSPVVDRSAPLAPDRVLTARERLEHLTARRESGALSEHEFERLAYALRVRG